MYSVWLKNADSKRWVTYSTTPLAGASSTISVCYCGAQGIEETYSRRLAGKDHCTLERARIAEPRLQVIGRR
jgi:hypothetical protein